MSLWSWKPTAVVWEWANVWWFLKMSKRIEGVGLVAQGVPEDTFWQFRALEELFISSLGINYILKAKIFHPSGLCPCNKHFCLQYVIHPLGWNTAFRVQNPVLPLCQLRNSPITTKNSVKSHTLMRKQFEFTEKCLSNHSTLTSLSSAWNDSKLQFYTNQLVQNWVLDNFGRPKMAKI